MLLVSMRFKRMRTRWPSHELLMLVILLLLNYGILPLQMPLGQVHGTKNEEAFEQGVIERPICDQGLQTKYCNSWYGGDLHTGIYLMTIRYILVVTSPLNNDTIQHSIIY